MDNRVKIKIDNILEETTQFDFPFFASEEKKKIILLEKKFYIDEEFKAIAPELFSNEEKMKEIWKESVKYAKKQFNSLPVKKRLNGFYLQELMYNYVERLRDSIIIHH